ncbi:MAG TPA: NAD-dependent epimerase/dehydratase family protein [Xanthomonadales bacterium]
MKVLVTGGGGFLGSAICRLLLAHGDQVIAYQRSAADELAKLGISVVRGDINDTELLNATMRGVDAVIHTAAKAGLSVNYDEYFAANVSGTQNVLDACRNHGVRKLVFTSSPSVTHGDVDIEGGDESLPYPETYSSPYPETKARSEQMVMAANSADLHTVSLRPHLIWGPGDNHLLPKLIERAKGGKLRLPGPDKLIDSVYIDNAARAHLLALDKLETRPETVGGKTYFISNDEPVTQARIIGGLLEAAGVTVDIQAISPRIAITAGTLLEAGWKLFGLKSEPPLTRWSAEHLSTAHWYDISAAKRDLGYSADISIAEGLEILAREYRQR